MKIKIKSNPYEKKIEYFAFNDFVHSWEDIRVNNPNSRLREDSSGKSFLPFQIKEIIDIIINEYYNDSNKIELVFEGTRDEYREVYQVCNEVGIREKIELTQSTMFLENARMIFDDAKEIFEKVRPIIEKTVKDDNSTTKSLNKVSEALNDVIPICVFGNYSAGKSTFINAMIGSEILPSGGDPVTAKVYKIMESYQNDVAKIRFELHEEAIDIVFEGDSYRVQKGDTDCELLVSVAEAISKSKKNDLATHVNVALELINAYEKKDREVKEISDLIEVEVPFSVNGILGQSHNNFVIFDTPGSNSASNLDHSEVLANALEDFSNGIPVWVSQYESIDSDDNASLCDKIFEIRALDKRFTMIVLNKADGSDLDEDGFSKEKEKEILEYKAVEKMYASGIYFVSSIMGLGAKNNGELTDKHYRKIFRSQQDMYTDPDDLDYATLYNYNIMPAQIKKQMINYSLDCSNIIYANSGLLAVEMEMENFATKHSAYNKCQMVYIFLNDVVEETKKRITEKANAVKKAREKAEKELDTAKTELINKITSDADDMEKRFVDDSKPSFSKYIENNINYAHDIEWIDKKDEELRNVKGEETNILEQEKELAEAKSNLWKNFKSNGKNLFKGNIFEQIKNMKEEFSQDIKIVHDNKESVDNAEKEIDKETADKLINFVVAEYRNNIILATESLNHGIKEYWYKVSQELRNEMICLVAGTDALSASQREEISNVIINYQPLEFSDNVDELFIKRKYLKGQFLGIKINDSEQINTKRLLGGYNDKIGKNVNEIGNTINTSCIASFNIWKQSLLATIDENITAYNTMLRELVEVIHVNNEIIMELEDNQQTICESLENIKDLMAWKAME